MHLYVHLPQLDQHYKLSTNFTHHKITLIHTYWAQMASDVTLVDVPWMSVVAFWMPTNLKRLGYTQKEKKLFRFICSCIWRNFAVTDSLPGLLPNVANFFYFNWANPGLFYHLFSVFSNKHHYNFCNKYMWKNVHPVYGARIRTHDLWNMSLLP